MNAFASGGLGGMPDPALAIAGTTVHFQWWARDAGFAPPDDLQLSDAFEYVVGP